MPEDKNSRCGRLGEDLNDGNYFEHAHEYELTSEKLADYIRDRIKPHNFVKFEWDGREVILSDSKGEAFCESEFTEGTDTAKMFDEFEELVEGLEPFVVE